MGGLRGATNVSVEVMQTRAALCASIRKYFGERGVLEVDTPLMSGSTATEVHLESFELAKSRQFLQTSPEFGMKRLLASGYQHIFQLCKAFRAGETGNRHNAEFTILEWYRIGFDEFELIEELATLVESCTDLAPYELISYQECFQAFLEIDPFDTSREVLGAIANARTGFEMTEESRGELLDLLMSHLIEPQLGKGRLTVIYNYPIELSGLAEHYIDTNGNTVARRFEAYLCGMELANGCKELRSPRELSARFAADIKQRKSCGLNQYPMPDELIAAHELGLPECSGVALGIDRLLMCMLGTKKIADVIAFADNEVPLD